MSEPDPASTVDLTHDAELIARIRQSAASDARDILKDRPDPEIATILCLLESRLAVDILASFGENRRNNILSHVPKDKVPVWLLNLHYPDSSVGRFMEVPSGLLSPDLTVAEAVEQLREMVKRAFITYGYAVEPDGRLVGVIVMRDLLLAQPEQKLSDLMLRDPFSLPPEVSAMDAMKMVLNRHYPVYPVCDEKGRLVGVIRGQTLFEQQAIEISAQVGSMVGVEREERISTPLKKSLFYRHPWLQLNLLTAFVAAAVVGVFEGTLEKIVILAVFLPVLAGQSGNTGCQALAVSLRGMTLGDYKTFSATKAVIKEGLLGLFNGALVGITAGIGMFFYARMTQNPEPLKLAIVVFVAMVVSCVVSGISGATIPLALKKLGADPATASSIFLTTATDVVSMGVFLGLATWWLL